jgi:hypothetical protein
MRSVRCRKLALTIRALVSRLRNAWALTLVGGGLKKAIRLCKSVKNDAEEENDTSITLPSFDIAATMYHADRRALSAGAAYELAILAEAQRFLDYLTMNQSEAVKLRVPDGSRVIFDTPQKLAGLRALSVEMDDLLREVAKEQSQSLAFGKPTLEQARAAVGGIFIAAA